MAEIELQEVINTLYEGEVALEGGKVDKTTEANKVYGTDATGAQKLYIGTDFGKVDSVDSISPDASKNVTLKYDIPTVPERQTIVVTPPYNFIAVTSANMVNGTYTYDQVMRFMNTGSLTGALPSYYNNIIHSELCIEGTNTYADYKVVVAGITRAQDCGSSTGAFRGRPCPYYAGDSINVSNNGGTIVWKWKHFVTFNGLTSVPAPPRKIQCTSLGVKCVDAYIVTRDYEVELWIKVINGTGNDDTLCTIPEGFRPPVQVGFGLIFNQTNTAGGLSYCDRLWILTTGVVHMETDNVVMASADYQIFRYFIGY